MKNLPKLVLGISIVAIIAVAGAGYFYYQYQKTQQELLSLKSDSIDPQKSKQEEIAKLVAEVSELIELPLDEEPTVATVTDVEKLKDQLFFAKAKNGDKVLIYPNAKKAILYNAEQKKVIDIAPINIGSDSAKTVQGKIALRNGTTVSGLAAKMESSIKAQYPGVVVESKDNAQKSDYTQTLVIPLSDLGKVLSANLTKILQATVGELPSGEKKPSGVDLLIIIGKDQIN